ncbi:MAG: hypothetical protein ACI85F_003032 [Bacteroidia bacterium]|jgi:hypothetical protein
MRIALIILLTVVSISCGAQTWAPFPLDGTSEWRETQGYRTGNFCWAQYERNLSVGDVVTFDGQDYTEINFSGVQWRESIEGQSTPEVCDQPLASIVGVAGYVRAENGRYYNYTGSVEELLFDFTLSEGDTMWFPESVAIVDSVDLVVVNGQSLKRLFYEPGTSGLLWSIEGIGHNLGFLQPVINFEGFSELNCYRENGTISYPENVSECSIVSVSEDSKHSLSVSPNPSTGIFRIETSQKSTIKIYDLYGRLVLQDLLNGSSEIDISSEPSGVYLIMVENEQGLSTTKLVKH